MTQSSLLSLTAKVRVHRQGQDIVLDDGEAALRMSKPGRALRLLVRDLKRGGMDRHALCAGSQGANGAGPDPAVRATLYFAVGRIEERGLR